MSGQFPKKRTSVLLPDAKGPVTAMVTGPPMDLSLWGVLCLSLLEVEVGQRVEGAGAEAAALAAAPAVGGAALLGLAARALLAAGTLLAVLALRAQAQGEPAAAGVHVDDAGVDLVAGAHDLVWRLHVMVGQLGDVDQTLHALGDLDEGPEGDELGDPAVDLLPDVDPLDDLLPGVLPGLLEAERDALAVAVDFEDLDLDLLANLDDLARMVDVLPS